jgi:hypothetical protein
LVLVLLAGLAARPPTATAATRTSDGLLASNPFAAGDVTVALGSSANSDASPAPPTGYEEAVLADKPALYLPLTETSGTTAFDHSGNGLDGTYANGVTHGEPGPLLSEANAAAFGAGQVVLQSGDQLPSSLSERTLEFWVHNTGNTYEPIRYGDVEHSHGFAVRIGDSHIEVEADGRTVLSTETVDGLGANHEFNCDSSGWHMVDVTYDGTKMGIYEEGQLLKSEEIGQLATAVPGQGLRLSVSSDKYAYGYPLCSTAPYGLGQTAIYPTALSPQAIDKHWTVAASYADATPCSITPLGPYPAAVLAGSPAVYYRFSDKAAHPTDRVAFDDSGHCANGTYDHGTSSGSGALLGDENTALFGAGQVAFQSGEHLPSSSSERTLEFWVHNTGNTYEPIRYGDVEHGHGFAVTIGNSHIEVVADGHTVLSTETVDGLGTNHEFNCDSSGWHMVDVTYNGTKMAIYQEGQLLKSEEIGPLATAVPGQGLRLSVSSDKYAYGYPLCSTAPYGLGEVAIYTAALSSAQIVAHWEAASQAPAGSSVIAGSAVINGHGGAQGARVQACPTSGGACKVDPYPVDAQGLFHMVVPNGTYTVTIFPPAGSPDGPRTVGPLTLPPSALNLTETFSPPGGLPEGVTLSSPGRGTQEKVVPGLNWGEQSTYSAPGCKNGFGSLDVQGTNSSTGQPEDVPSELVETPSGSGTYVAQIPPLAPMHGSANFSPLIVCPEHSAVFPNGGTAAGGTQVLLTGSGFMGATGVSFGSQAAKSFEVLDDHLIIAVSPAGTGDDEVSVTASDAHEISVGDFSYFGVTSLDTTSGTAEGGTSVAIHGYGFSNVQSVVFGIMPAQSFTVVSPTEIDAVAPAGLGTVDVQVINGLASSDLGAPKMFTYQGGPPGSSSINEGTGPNAVQNLAAQYSGFLKSAALPPALLLPLRATAEWILLHLQGPVAALLRVGFNVITHFCKLYGGGCTEAFGVLLSSVGDFFAAVAAPVVAGILVGFEIYEGLKTLCGWRGKGGLWGFCNLYIDPSGAVVDAMGNPISGATATLLEQPLAVDPFTPVPPLSGAIEPAENPETTGTSGQFDWNALAGTYEVEASAPGCHAPGEESQPDVFTSPFVLPPPAVGLTLTLECAGGTAPTPKVTGLSVLGGATAGGNTVDILGEDLTDVTSVHFGGSASVDLQTLSPYAVAAVAPAGSGTVDVTVSGPGGTSATAEADHYTYSVPVVTANSPVVESVAPGSGPLSGGTVVTIKGSHLAGAFSVEFGGTSSTQVTPISESEVQAVAPAAAFPERVDVTVTTSSGDSAPTLADSFAYGSPRPPVATSVTLTPSPNPVTAGQTLGLTAVVAPSDGGGSVAFYADGSSTPVSGCGAHTLSLAGAGYQATCSTTGLAVGSHTLSATYTGDASYAGSSGSANLSVSSPPEATGGGSTTGSGNGGSSPGTKGGVLGNQSAKASAAQIAALLAGQLAPSGRAAKIAALVRRGGWTESFRALEAGIAVIDWYELPKGAKLAKKTKVKPVLVAAGRLTFSAAGTATLNVKLTSTGKRLLKSAKHLKLTARGTFTPTGTAPVTATKTFVLKR